MINDILILANDKIFIEKTKRSLANTFMMKDLGEIKNFLGMKKGFDSEETLDKSTKRRLLH